MNKNVFFGHRPKIKPINNLFNYKIFTFLILPKKFYPPYQSCPLELQTALPLADISYVRIIDCERKK
jgi:hypothetical protein